MSGLWRYNMSRYVEHSQAMFVRPAQHLGPTHSAANETRGSMHWHSPLGGELCHATNAVGSDILGVPSSTTTPNRIHLSAQPHHLILHYFTESSWKWPVSTNLASNSWHKNMRSCLSISSGLPNYQFHQTQENSRNLGRTLLHKYRLVVLHQHVINFQQWHFGVKDWKHQPLSSSNGSILLGLARNMRGIILTNLPFAVEMWAQMGQITNAAWKNTCGTLPVQLQQWHPCEWQD